MHDVETQLGDYWADLVADHPVPSAIELMAPSAPFVDGVVHDVEPAAGPPRSDAAVFNSRWQVDEGTARSERKRWVGALTAAAATVLIVAGVLVVADRDRGGVEPSSASVGDPVPSPEEPDPTATPQDPSALTWSRVPDDKAGVRDDGGGFMSSVVAGGPGFVAVGWAYEAADTQVAAIWTSIDGAGWSRVPHDDAIFTSGSMSSVIVAGPGLVAVGQVDDHAAVWTSPDGVTWSRVSHDEAVFDGPGDQRMSGVTVGGPGLVAVGHDEINGAAVWTSADGSVWARVAPSDVVSSGDRETFMTAVTAGGPGLVAVGAGERPDALDVDPERVVQVVSPTVWTSPDGIHWSEIRDDAAFLGGGSGAFYPQISSVTTGGPGLVAVGRIDNQAAVWTSPDGVAWSRVPHDEDILGAAWTSMSDVIDVGSGLSAVGVSHGQAAVWSSLDGVAWHREPHDVSLFGAPISPDSLGQAADHGVRYGMAAVAAGPSGLVAVGVDGPVDAAPVDAIVWIAEPE